MMRLLPLLLPAATSALRLSDNPLLLNKQRDSEVLDSDVVMSTGSSIGYMKMLSERAREGESAGAERSSGAGTVNNTDWPERWLIAHEHGHTIAHQLDLERLVKFVHAVSGNPESSYTAETMALPDYNIPAMKMQNAVPGWQARSEEEAKRVTGFPSYLALASSWDKDLVYEVAMAVSEEFKTLGANVMLGPAINIHRNTQHEEEFDSLAGEDPTLGSVLVRSWILATQTHGIMSVPKSIGKSEQGPVHTDDSWSTLSAWDIYYPAFETAVDCGAAGIMCDAHESNGLWSCRDKEMLDRDLKGIMHFHGMVLSDKNTAKDYFEYASTYEQGTDLEWDEPETVSLSEHRVSAMRDAATRIMASIWHMKFEEDPGCQPPNCAEDLAKVATTPAHVEVAKRAAGSSVILVQNHAEFLPIVKGKGVQKVAVFGPGSKRKMNHEVFATPFDVIAKHGRDLGFNVYDSLEYDVDVCVVIGGSHDAEHWSIDEDTNDAIDEAVESCPRAGVFLELDGALVPHFKDDVFAFAVTFHAGEETAFSWAALMFGDVSPSGKLPISFPSHEQDERRWWAERRQSYWDTNANFAYYFGHGLSYAKFWFLDVKLKPKCHFPLCLVLKVVNVDNRFSGSEVVQVYFKFPDGAHHPTVLRGFHKTKVLAPHEEEKVFFPFTHRDISLYRDSGEVDEEKSWIPQDSVTIMVGSSFQDIRATIEAKPKFG